MKLRDEFDRLIDLVSPRDPQRDRQRHERWRCVGGATEDEADYLPLMVHVVDQENPDEQAERWPGHARFTLAEQLADPEKMLFERLILVPQVCRTASDAAPMVAPMFGNAFLLTALGLDVVCKDDCLEPVRPLRREEASRLEMPADISKVGMVKQALDYMDYARNLLPDRIDVGLCFMMSPYDLAYLIRGAALITDMYEDPDFVHNLMQLCTDLFLQATQVLKARSDEPDDFHYYQGMTFSGGGLLCEDCCIMLSPDLHREFSMPYTRQAFDALGGGWIHFCGNGQHILPAYIEEPGFHGLQYGQVDLNGPLKDVAKDFCTNGKAFNCSVNRTADESWLDAFTRTLGMLSRKKGLFGTVYTTTKDPDVPRLQAIWHEAHKQVFVEKSRD